ncbi:MAG TPA: hypothetical protein PLO37_15115 [Candidatus Hydrogenedentes bacterium]|mgnify:CR=1 FL=1|nr:hypothetical protein [Candidatus Hydrogenedentota bacterium]
MCKCGTAVSIPSGRENDPVRCPNCLEFVNKRDPKPKENKQKSEKAPKRRPYVPMAERDWGFIAARTFKTAVIAGLIGMVIGVVLGAGVAPLLGEVESRTGPAAVWSFFGILFGVLFGSTWGISRAADLRLLGSITFGVCTSVVLSTVDWLVEMLVPTTDATALECYAVGIMSGIVTGLIVGLLNNEPA